MKDDSSVEDLIDEIADEFVTRMHAGESPKISEYCLRYPKIASELRDFLRPLKMLEAGKADSIKRRLEDEGEIEQVQDYRIVRELGRGGMGIVYEAFHQPLGRRVALKVLPKRISGDKQALGRFNREARAIAKLHHTNIVPLFEVGEDDGRSFLVMQLIAGQSLSSLIADAKSICALAPDRDERKRASASLSGSNRLAKLSDPSTSELLRENAFRWVANIGAQTADALAYAHHRDIIHRDVKPSNILLDDQGVVWLTDFGLAKMDDDDGLTQTGDFVGTLRYIAPERFNQQCDERADIYGLGLTLYELLTLQPAYRSTDRMALMDLVRTSAPPSLRSLNARVPHDLETIVLKACDREPASRYGSACELANDLRRFIADEPILARRVSVTEHLFRWCRRNKSLVAALATVAALLATIAIVTTIMAINSRRLRQEAEGHQAVAEDRGEALRQSLYYAQMNLGGSLASDHVGVDSLDELTASWNPKRDQEDLRGWEWYYLRSLIHDDGQILKGHKKGVWSFAWSPDQTMMATASLDKTVCIWDAESRTILQTLKHPDPVWTVAWSPNGNRVATSCDDGRLRIWNADTWDKSRTMDAHVGNHVGTVNWSPDGRFLVSSSSDHTARIWAADSGMPIGRPLLHEGKSVRGALWSPDGKLIASTCYPGDAIYLWKVTDQDHILWKKLKGHQAINSLSWNSTSSLVASSGTDGSVRVWDIATSRVLFNFDDHVGSAMRTGWGPDDMLLASPSTDGTVRVWNTVDGKATAVLRTPGVEALCAVWSQDAKRLAAGCSNGSVRLWDMASRRQPTLDGRARVAFLTWSHDGESVVSISDEGKIRTWNPSTGSVSSSPGLKEAIYCNFVKWSPNGKCFAWVHETTQEINVMDSSTGEYLLMAKSVPGMRGAICWSPDSKGLAIAKRDGFVDILDTESWQQSRTLDLQSTSRAVSLDWSDDGRSLVCEIGNTGTAIFNMASGELTSSTKKPTLMTDYRWSRNAKMLAARWGSKAYAWPSKDEDSLVIFSGHTLMVTDLSWNHDGTRLATSSTDGMVKIWDAHTGQLALTLDVGKSVDCVSWHPDGKRIAAGSVDGKIRVWDASRGY